MCQQANNKHLQRIYALVGRASTGSDNVLSPIRRQAII